MVIVEATRVQSLIGCHTSDTTCGYVIEMLGKGPREDKEEDVNKTVP